MTLVLEQQRVRNAYQTSQVTEQDPLGLVVQLYDGLLGFARRGAEALATRNTPAAAEPIRRAADIIGELQATLDMERGGEISANLDRLYGYCRRRIMEAHLQSSPAPLQEVINLLTPLRDAWSEAREQQAVGAGV